MHFNGRIVTWATDGQRFHNSFHDRDRPDSGPKDAYDGLSYDGKTTWQLRPKVGRPSNEIDCVVKQALRTATDTQLRLATTPGRWLGLYFSMSRKSQTGVSLLELFNNASTTSHGTELVGSIECQKVGFTIDRPIGGTIPITVWFDPTAGYLPRRILFEKDEVDLAVEHFKRIDSPDAKPVWFPEHMSLTHPSVNVKDELLLRSIQVGGNLPQNLFAPSIPPGVPVFEVDTVEGKAKLQAHLGRTPVLEGKAIVAKRTAVGAASAFPASGRISASQPFRWGTSHWLLATLFVLLCVGTLRTLKSRRD